MLGVMVVMGSLRRLVHFQYPFCVEGYSVPIIQNENDTHLQ